MITVGVLVPRYSGGPGVPEDRPIGRAALALAEEGIQVLMGDHAADGALHGVVATPGAWAPHSAPVAAVFDRFPSQSQADRYATLVEELSGVPWGNPQSLVMLCRDKIRTQQLLAAHGVEMPAMETDPARFDEALEAWGSAYLKPRYGAFGRGVKRVSPGDPLPATVEGSLRGVQEPSFLQRAVSPPPQFAAVACRVLVQQGANGFVVCPPVVRSSTTDPVANAARGAHVTAAEDSWPESVAALTELARTTTEVLSAQCPGTLEIGIDAVLDDSGAPHLIEANSRPRGRLEALARLHPKRFGHAHLSAVKRPLRYLARLAAQGSPD